MSDVIELKVPDIGNVAEVEVIEVFIKAGDFIELEQSILVMETDKASMELPAISTGTVQDVVVHVGDKVSEGTVVATLVVKVDAVDNKVIEDSANIAINSVQPNKSIAKNSTETDNSSKNQKVIIDEVQVNSINKAHATPGVRRFARELGVNLSQIHSGTGRKDRILKDDVKNFVKQQLASTEGANTIGSGIPALPVVDFSKFGIIEEQALNKIKRLTGKHLSCKWLNLPMVTQHEEADITDMEAFRKTLNTEQVVAGQPKITPLAFIIKAVLAAMTKHPQFNSSLSTNGETLIYKKYFNIGIAVDTPNGLVVPVIKQADQKSILELVEAMIVLSTQAREGKLLPSDMQGGCLTISSLGGIGGTGFTPIVNAPEVAILGVARASMKPIWDGSNFRPKLMLPLDLTYDHRVIDGADGARFVVTIAQYLKDLRRLLI
jgi:pyruvate dehydrogenase E2 component (dihydrolipoamide acetyltransferase)